MPADILLPLFALTLLANVILVAIAIRGMRRGEPDVDRPIETGRPLKMPTPAAAPAVAGSASRDAGRPMSEELARAIAARRTPPDPQPLVPAAAEPAPRAEADPGPPGEPVTIDDAVVSEEVQAVSMPSSKRRRTTKRASPADTGDPRPAGSRPAEARRGRRRFALPPLDDDHERVSRSIETFLGGMETTDADTPPGAEESPAGHSTVALVAVHEPPEDGAVDAAGGGRISTGSAVEAAAVTDALAMVERTIRGAARGTDVVTIGGHGRFRIVLPSTGELAARAYLRRIRATIEPRLVAANRPLRLTVATVTVHDEPLEDAVRRAEHRLSAALDDAGLAAGGTAADPDSGTLDEPSLPRAATD